MKRIAFVLLIVAALTASASAYSFVFEVPSTIYKGEDIYIEGSSNLPAGTTMQLALYQQKGTIKELERNSLTIQDGGYWSTYFETSDLSAGTYKIGVPTEYSGDLGSSSTNNQMFEIVDRSSEIVITSSSEQQYNGYLKISGKCATRGSAGVQLLVEGPYGIVYPKQWISTDSSGYFSESVPIETEGTFEASFYDNNGLIAMVTFEVTPGVMTPQPTTSSNTSSTGTGSIMQAQAFSSFSSPAYFTVETEPGILEIYTSAGKNWVVCYVGEDLAEFTVDQHNDNSAEKVTIPVEGGKVYVKVYPADESESGYVTLYADGASSIKVSSDAEEIFSNLENEKNPQSGPEMWIALISACIAFAVAGFAIKRQ
ncbi:hypothetical protein [Methanolacinia paynteri]|uniref:hypothetical protein n=1 Tax=Methanolacinia paynteri TaxID=230356 RepID=UPI00064E6D32|nr:hypothetical protein [Methanolacinia paynteri]